MNKNDDAMVNKELFYMRTIVLKKNSACFKSHEVLVL